jgi:phosphoribosylaminoimidazole-succinocarboxamide synthase
MNALHETNFQLPGQTAFYRGKVRDVYSLGERLVMVASDRISAFDHILPRAIPHKGAVLNQIAAYFLQSTRDICPNWLIATPDPNVAIGWRCEPVRVEMVIRGYLVGHAARTYASGLRTLCGVALPDGLRENDPFPEPIITPTLKAEEGHDEDISREEILARGVVSEEDYVQMEAYTRALFQRGTEMAAAQGLILVDTKYEFGKKDGKIMLMDEIHTPDSSPLFLRRRLYGTSGQRRAPAPVEQGICTRMADCQWVSGKRRATNAHDARCICEGNFRSLHRTIRAGDRSAVCKRRVQKYRRANRGECVGCFGVDVIFYYLH